MSKTISQITDLPKRERVERACKEVLEILKEEEGIRVASTKRQKDNIKAVADKYQVDSAYITKLMQKNSRTYQV